MNSKNYEWYYKKTNMPLWLFLAPGRWWAELEYHLAGNGRLFLSARRRRSIVWHGLYSILFYVLIAFGLLSSAGGLSRDGVGSGGGRSHSINEVSPRAVGDGPTGQPSLVTAGAAEPSTAPATALADGAPLLSTEPSLDAETPPPAFESQGGVIAHQGEQTSGDVAMEDADAAADGGARSDDSL